MYALSSQRVETCSTRGQEKKKPFTSGRKVSAHGLSGSNYSNTTTILTMDYIVCDC